jgi:hypothetical protein
MKKLIIYVFYITPAMADIVHTASVEDVDFDAIEETILKQKQEKERRAAEKSMHVSTHADSGDSSTDSDDSDYLPDPVDDSDGIFSFQKKTKVVKKTKRHNEKFLAKMADMDTIIDDIPKPRQDSRYNRRRAPRVSYYDNTGEELEDGAWGDMETDNWWNYIDNPDLDKKADTRKETSFTGVGHRLGVGQHTPWWERDTTSTKTLRKFAYGSDASSEEEQDSSDEIRNARLRYTSSIPGSTDMKSLNKWMEAIQDKLRFLAGAHGNIETLTDDISCNIDQIVNKVDIIEEKLDKVLALLGDHD